MAKPVIMPKFGFSQETATIMTWIKHEGDEVEQGDPLAEVTTDKVNMEVEAPATGILAGLKYQEGDTVPVTELIAYILAPGESLPDGGSVEAPAAKERGELTTPAKPGPVDAEDKPMRITPLAKQYARDKGVDVSQVAASGNSGRITRGDIDQYLQASQLPGGKVRATPKARRLAHEEGANLSQVNGSGPQGRIQGWDVEEYIRQSEPAGQAAQAVMAEPAAQETIIPLSNVRRIIAERLQHSAQQAPHVYFDVDVDTTQLESLRKRANEKMAGEQTSISITTVLVKVVAWALTRHPYLNSRLAEDAIHLLPEINIGVAVQAESGLIVPVLRSVNRKQLSQLASEWSTLVGRARENKLRPDDVSGGSFTISNLGMYGVDRFTAIINPPQAAILAVGRIRRVFAPDENDAPVVRPLMTLTLGVDHRVVDGALAARFLADVREGIEHPEILSL